MIPQTPTAHRHRLAILGFAAAIPLALTSVPAHAITQGPELQMHIAAEPATGWYRTPVNVLVSARPAAADDRITGVHWWSRGPVSANGDAIGENEISFTIDADGETRITYTATTAQGGFSQGEATVRVDTIPPAIRFTAPTTPGAPGALPRVALGSSTRLAVACEDAHSGIEFCGEELPLVATRALPLDTGSLGRKLIVVEAADVAGNRSKASFAYEVVRSVPTALANTAKPRISGTVKVGKKLTAKRGSWSGAPTSYSYQWYRGSKKIAEATKSSYRLKSADRGKRIRVKIPAKRAGSMSRSAYSAATGRVRG
ncbi:MAG: hypothetical protein J0H64_06435 [Actinobacteria bacterium]|nr:hypothetical protein [Actinomycetota bacterium]